MLGTYLSPLAKRLFHVNGIGASVFIIGIICGYPTGAKTAAELVEEGRLSREDAEHLLPFCNNAGPLFVMGAVGGLLSDPLLGYQLYFLHLLSAFLTGILLSGRKVPPKNSSSIAIQSVSIGTAIQKSMQSAIFSTMTVCGYILLFSVLLAFLPKQENAIFSLLYGFLEVTSGAANISVSACHTGLKAVFLSSLIGFGGLCVFLQVWGIVTPVGISVRSYLTGKLLQACVSAGLAYLFLWDAPFPVSRCWVVLIFFLFALKLTKPFKKSIIRKEPRIKGAS